MRQVFDLVDRIVVFRRGRVVANLNRDETDPQDVVACITGAKTGDSIPLPKGKEGRTACPGEPAAAAGAVRGRGAAGRVRTLLPAPPPPGDVRHRRRSGQGAKRFPQAAFVDA